MAPPPKKQRTDEPTEKEVDQDTEMEANEEVEKEPEEPKELEEDFKPDTKPKITETATFLVPDTTMNILPSTVGDILMPLCDGGLQYLLAGARGSVGVKSGRYMFEAKIVAFLNPMEDQIRHGGRPPTPKKLLRIGFSTAGSSLFLGEGEDSICFDSEGMLAHNRKLTRIGGKFDRDVVISVVLNLEEKSPNFNTISLFREGVRVCQPQPLPESLQGRALFPTATFRNVSVHVNFGPQPMAPLPFKCKMIQDALKTHATVTTHDSPKDGKYEVLYPVGLPGEGVFAWLDMFLEKNPHYVELSERAILAWAEKSGVFRPHGYAHRASNDKPGVGFGIPSLDNASVHSILQEVAPLQPRNFVVMELKGNLTSSDRLAALPVFKNPTFRSVAQILIGEPTADFKARSQAALLDEKQQIADAEFRANKAEEKRKKLLEKRQKEEEKKKEKLRKKVEEEQKRRAEEMQKKAVDANDNMEEEKKDVQEESEKPETVEKKEVSEEEGEEEKEEEDVDEDPPKVALTDDEKKEWFVKSAIPDLTDAVLNASFAHFSVPEKDEGFDEVRCIWSKESKCEEHLKRWVLNRKLTVRIDDLQPSEWFHARLREWQRALLAWHSKQNEYEKKSALKAQLAQQQQSDKAMAELKKKAEAKAMEAKAAAATQNSEEGQGNDDEKKKDEEKKDVDAKEEQEEEEEEEAPKVDFDKLDVFDAKDILDCDGEGMPLFRDFQREDWAMASLRFELSLLAHSFRRDANDPERTGIHLDHLAFYYNKYYKKPLVIESYGVDAAKELIALVSDTVQVTSSQVMESQLPQDLETFAIFAKLTEEARRHRNLLVDSGEESARLKISSPLSGTLQASGQQTWCSGGKGSPHRPLQQQYFQNQQNQQEQHQQHQQQQHHQNQQIRPPMTVAPRIGYGNQVKGGNQGKPVGAKLNMFQSGASWNTKSVGGIRPPNSGHQARPHQNAWRARG